MSNRIPREQLKLIFADILRGYSSLIYKDREIYVKHLGNFDVADIDIKNNTFFQKAVKSNLPSLKDREKFVTEQGLWPESKNREIKEQERFIETLKMGLSKLNLKSELEEFENRLKEERDKLNSILLEKNILIQPENTAETYASRRTNEYYIYKSMFKNQEITTPLFTGEEFSELDDFNLGQIVDAYNELTVSFTTYNLQRIALCPFFMNIFALSEDNAFNFWGKPIVSLTFYQIELFSSAKYFRSILSEMKEQPPEEVLDHPEKLLKNHNLQKNNEKLTGGEGVNSLVGATEEELKESGVIRPGNVIDFAAEAKKRGKSKLNIQDMVGILGQ